MSPAPDIDLGWLIPQPDIPVLGRLPLPNDDFQTHRALFHHICSYLISTENPSPSNAIRAPDDTTRSPHTRRTRSQTAIMPGNTPSRPNYRMAAHGGCTASAASSPPLLHPSPPPRSTHLGATTSDRPALPRLTLASSRPHLDYPPLAAPLNLTAHGVDVEARAVYRFLRLAYLQSPRLGTSTT